ncbi:hypothetical protein MmTuc01_0983 [Methanosarcina mazei Tuc01]|uniref:Uncharacterized protein n=1 Tax=Methanosarcina mazei Tuc01 TaxID=1236903 RepID=M1P7J2_METMZ|nr:hypothetical protein MmTuc01_0983 [Methanosarcina mazei Tuc01]
MNKIKEKNGVKDMFLSLFYKAVEIAYTSTVFKFFYCM